MTTWARRLFDDLRTLRVLVIHPPGDDRNVLDEQLRRIGCLVTVVWPFPSPLPADADVVFFWSAPTRAGRATGAPPTRRQR